MDASESKRGAATDPLDEHFPRRGQCLLCGVPGEDQRHRVVDAVADRVRAGDGEDEVAADYGITLEAVRAAVLHAPVYSYQENDVD